MDGIRTYILSVTAAAVFCGIVNSLIPGKGSFGQITKLVSGLVLAFTVISPLADIQISELSIFTDGIAADAQAAVSLGEDYAQAALRQRIKQETEAYILDKATAYGATVQVEVLLSEDLTPNGSIIQGNLSPYLRRQLEKILENDLGIAKEAQQWKDP